MRVWALQGPRNGDNSQALALAGALGLRTEVKALAFNWRRHLRSRITGASISSIKLGRSDDLKPPWPDAVIAVGHRTVPVARWIKARSGDAALIQIGRPRAPLDLFDLVITTPQYGLPDAENVIQNTLPLTPGAPPAYDGPVKLWRAKFSYLPRPWTAIFVGASAWPFQLAIAEVERLADRAMALAHKTGGSLIVTASPRTPAPVLAALEAALTGPERRIPAYVHGPKDDWGNPHRALLTLADNFIVTGDSASMLAEACFTGRPVWLFQLPVRGRLAAHLADNYNPVTETRGAGARLMNALARRGLVGRPRNIARIHARLLNTGFVGLLDHALVAPRASAQGLQQRELTATVARIRELLNHRQSESRTPPAPSVPVDVAEHRVAASPASGVI